MSLSHRDQTSFLINLNKYQPNFDRPQGRHCVSPTDFKYNVTTFEKLLLFPKLLEEYLKMYIDNKDSTHFCIKINIDEYYIPYESLILLCQYRLAYSVDVAESRLIDTLEFMVTEHLNLRSLYKNKKMIVKYLSADITSIVEKYIVK